MHALICYTIYQEWIIVELTQVFIHEDKLLNKSLENNNQDNLLKIY